MKPSFALSLSFEGIRLLHRAAGGWRVVGEVELDSEDLAAELQVLRKTATALEPAGLRSKLLIPNEQIKYLSIDTPGLDDAARKEAAKAALDGATPYAVSDLVYDISVDGDRTHIAAAARETLAEAEAFATEHRFNPVSFAAIPGDQAYLGEPFFGQTRAATDLLEPGQSVDPDGIAVVVIGDVDLKKATAPAPAPEVPEEPEPVVEKAPDPEKAAPATPADGDTPPKEAEDASPAEDRAEAPAAPAPAASKAAPDPAKAAPAPTVKKPEPKSANVSAPGLPSEDAPEDKAPTAARETAKPEDTKPSIGFATRRAPEKAQTPQLGGAQRGAPFAATPVSAFPDPTAPSPSAGAPDRIAIQPDSSSLSAEPSAPPPAAKSGFLSRRRDRQQKKQGAQPVPAPAAPSLATATQSEQERMTVFGARKTEVGGKPRYLGLMLTAALLIFLAGVAAWASVFLDDGLKLSRLFGQREEPQAFSAATPAPVLEEVEVPQAIQEPEPEADVQTVSLSPELTEEDTAVLDALSEPETAEPDAPLTEDEMAARYATSGIWPRAPEVPPEPAGLVDLDDLYVTSIDPVSTAADAIALPPADAFVSDEVLAAVASPPAAGTQFTLNDAGLVVPTAAGALSPDGYTVFLGRPPAVPPATPTRFQTEPEDTVVRSALAAVRPQPRPTDLIENTERAQLDGLTRSELAGYRPVLRPISLQQEAEAEAEAEAAETAAINTDNAVAAALETPPAIENATRNAVAQSRRPDTRPRNFARIVQRAQRNPENTEVRVASAAAVAPKVVQPKIPSKTSVAKQATVKNAVNLRQINLIGVYGKPSSRRALVRLGNGRYQKVVVGDRLDGGRVSAIGDSELRYTKRGRDMVLKMPR